ncbi:hypothetical protein [Vibrio navarrensis]|uniref:hypothetical protein n=1 Tax=Vibrio navarrensis TaxID=29495 RepID=UPI001559C92D|nr:hypothetical protein [Vibrio navarrensis]
MHHIFDRSAKNWTCALLLLFSCTLGASERTPSQDAPLIGSRYVVDDIIVTPSTSLDYRNIYVAAKGYDNNVLEDVTIPDSIYKDSIYLVCKGTVDVMPKKNSADVGEWGFEALELEGPGPTLRVRTKRHGAEYWCVWIRDLQAKGGWHNSCKDNRTYGSLSAYIVPPADLNVARRNPIATMPWSTNSTMYFWRDGTHSEFKSNKITKSTGGFDSNGYRSNQELDDWSFN